MTVRELIKELLDCNMDDEVEVLLSKGFTSKIHVIHDSSVRAFNHTGVMNVCIECLDDLEVKDN